SMVSSSPAARSSSASTISLIISHSAATFETSSSTGVRNHDHRQTYPGPFIVDLQNVQDQLIDLPDGTLQRLRSKKPGIEAVLEELARSVPTRGEEAGVSL